MNPAPVGLMLISLLSRAEFSAAEAGAVLKTDPKILTFVVGLSKRHAGHAAIATSASVRGHGEVWAHRHNG
jgi:hypothetical protein